MRQSKEVALNLPAARRFLAFQANLQTPISRPLQGETMFATFSYSAYGCSLPFLDRAILNSFPRS